MAPSTTKQWTVQGKNGFDSLKWDEKAPVPSLGDKDVLVKCKYACHVALQNHPISNSHVLVYAASLNFRDLAIPKVCTSFHSCRPRAPPATC